MGIFSKKKKNTDIEKKKKEIEKILDKYRNTENFPESSLKDSDIKSQEYKTFTEEELASRVKDTLYEKLCSFAGRIRRITPDRNMKLRLEKAIRFTGLNVTPGEVMSLTVMTFSALLFLAFFVFLIPSALLPLPFKLFFLTLPFVSIYFVLYYPLHHAAIIRAKSGRELVVSVLYIAMYMKSTPSLEGAIRFAANSLSGKLGYDLKRVLWQVETGQYSNVTDALNDYMLQWKGTNKEFIEAILLIRQSRNESSRLGRDILLDKAIDTVLQGTSEKLNKYARDLRTPVMVVHGMGILLPVLGMIVFPLMAVFMGDQLANLALYLAFGYNILLPVIVYLLISEVLNKRPATFTQVDISEHPDAIPTDQFEVRIGKLKKRITVWPFAVFISIALGIFGFGFMLSSDFFRVVPGTGEALTPSAVTLAISLSIVWALGAGLIFYFWGTSSQKIRLRNEINEIEDEFKEALFALGNRLSGGVPTELALQKAEEDTKELKISSFFRSSLYNMNVLGMTFRQAIFDREFGVIKFYPSLMIRTIMRSISEAIEKGTKAASITMLTISRYMRSMHSTQEKIEDILSESTSSMKFQAFLLVPTISAVVVATAQIIMKIMAGLSKQMAELGAVGGGMSEMDITTLFTGGNATPPELLQLVVGIYVLEILVLLGMFINRIEVGQDKIKENDMIWKMLLVGLIVYTVILSIVTLVFGGIIDAALTSI